MTIGQIFCLQLFHKGYKNEHLDSSLIIILKSEVGLSTSRDRATAQASLGDLVFAENQRSPVSLSVTLALGSDQCSS